MLRHVVVFTINSDADVKGAITKLRDLCQNSPLLADWRVEASLDTRKGPVIIQNTLLKEGVDIEQWRNTPKHKKVVEYMSKISDWLVADYQE